MAVFAACSSFGSNDDATPSDGGPDAASPPVDAPVADAPGIPSVPCDVTKPFTTKTPIADVNTDGFDESTPRLSEDELAMVFDSNSPSGGLAYDLFLASRPGLDKPFAKGPPSLANVSSSAVEAHAWISADRTALFFARANGGSFRLFQASRATATADFGSLAELATLEDPVGQEYAPFATRTLDLYYTATTADAGLPRLYKATRDGSGRFQPSAPLVIAGIPTKAIVEFPTPSRDELTLYFSVIAIEDDGGQGVQQIWVATRTTGNEFTGAHPVAELGSSHNTTPGWLSNDGCRLYYTLQTGTRDIYVASRTP